ncbi:hypothetical protein BN1708_020115, partial [Verticillium longisporum]
PQGLQSHSRADHHTCPRQRNNK